MKGSRDNINTSQRDFVTGESSVHDNILCGSSNDATSNQQLQIPSENYCDPKERGNYSFLQNNWRLDSELEDVSLRMWLNTANRAVDSVECLHIFKQILDMVSLAHSDGVVLQNIRPSCFMLSSFNRVSFIESASFTSSGSEASHDSGGGLNDISDKKAKAHNDTHERSTHKNVGQSSGTNYLPPHSSVFTSGHDCNDITSHLMQVEDSKGDMQARFHEDENAAKASSSLPLKEILLIELNWYTSPEEIAGESISLSSDIYCLGVLFFELFCTVGSETEQQVTMSNLRHRILPPQLLRKWPKEASFCLRLLHPDPSSRPTVSEIMQSEMIAGANESLEEWQSAIKIKEKIIDTELLSDFLHHLQRQKQERAKEISDSVTFLTSDIHNIRRQHSSNLLNSMDPSSQVDQANVSDISSARVTILGKHSRIDGSNIRENLQTEIEESIFQSNGGEELQSKRARLTRNFKKLEQVYFSMRPAVRPDFATSLGRNFESGIVGGESVVERKDLKLFSVNSLTQGKRRDDRLGVFFDSLSKFLRFSKFEVKANLKQGDLLNSSNLVCSLGFDRDKEYFATAGVNKKIKVFEYDMVVNGATDICYPVKEISGGSKFSCICWNSFVKSQIVSSDFEGAVRLWDISRGESVLELKEHTKRAWSVDFSQSDPKRLASGSDDCTVKLWSVNEAGNIGTITTKANICCVQFAPHTANLIAVGSADHKVYCYDLRNLKVPCHVLANHSKTVSYVKFIDSTSLVSASTDNSIKLWDLTMNKGRILRNPVQTYTGHTNLKNFVGLSIVDGYIATGSETNEVYVYHQSLPMPMSSYKFNYAEPAMGFDIEDESSQFVSCVCWKGQTHTLVSANSAGNLNILEMV